MQDPESPLSKYALAVTDAAHPATSPPEKQWDGHASRFDKPSTDEQESYGAVVYPDRKEVPFAITRDTVHMRMLDGFLHGLPAGDILESVNEQTKVAMASRKSPEIDVFVCVSTGRLLEVAK